jgi:hypothetical protein
MSCDMFKYQTISINNLLTSHLFQIHCKDGTMLIELIILILAIPQLVTFTLESRKISWKIITNLDPYPYFH